MEFKADVSGVLGRGGIKKKKGNKTASIKITFTLSEEKNRFSHKNSVGGHQN